jgi:hypothetical protein
MVLDSKLFYYYTTQYIEVHYDTTDQKEEKGIGFSTKSLISSRFEWGRLHTNRYTDP